MKGIEIPNNQIQVIKQKIYKQHKIYINIEVKFQNKY